MIIIFTEFLNNTSEGQKLSIDNSNLSIDEINHYIQLAIQEFGNDFVNNHGNGWFSRVTFNIFDEFINNYLAKYINVSALANLNDFIFYQQLYNNKIVPSPFLMGFIQTVNSKFPKNITIYKDYFNYQHYNSGFKYVNLFDFDYDTMPQFKVFKGGLLPWLFFTDFGTPREYSYIKLKLLNNTSVNIFNLLSKNTGGDWVTINNNRVYIENPIVSPQGKEMYHYFQFILDVLYDYLKTNTNPLPITFVASVLESFGEEHPDIVRHANQGLVNTLRNKRETLNNDISKDCIDYCHYLNNTTGGNLAINFLYHYDIIQYNDHDDTSLMAVIPRYDKNYLPLNHTPVIDDKNFYKCCGDIIANQFSTINDCYKILPKKQIC